MFWMEMFLLKHEFGLLLPPRDEVFMKYAWNKNNL